MTDLWHHRGRAGALALVVLAAVASVPASAAPATGAATAARRAAIVLPTSVRPEPPEPSAAALASGLDALLPDTAQDLGLVVEPIPRGALGPGSPTERALAARARASAALVIAPSIELRGDDVELRLSLASPASPALRVRIELAPRGDVAARAAVMLRDLVASADGEGRSAGVQHGQAPPCEDSPGAALATPARSAGRASLAVAATLYGGLVGYSIQRYSGSDDPRLLYPLLAVGAGIGLGGAMIIAEEWDVGLGDAWFLAAGAWWPTLAGHLIYAGRFAPHADDPDESRWAFGLVGGATGVSLAALGLALGDMSDGGAMAANSGGGLGLVLGGLAEWAALGNVNKGDRSGSRARPDRIRMPLAGMGYGAALGWLAAAAAATRLRINTSRVLAIDLGALLGGLGGAALGSPLVFDSPTVDQQRAWVAATAGGLLLGAGVAWFITRTPPESGQRGEPRKASWMGAGLPMIGVVGESVSGSRSAPVLGLGFRGAMP